MIDATVGINCKTPRKFSSIIVLAQKGVVILVNKWDAIEKILKLLFEKRIKENSPIFRCSGVFISTTKKQRIYQAMNKNYWKFI